MKIILIVLLLILTKLDAESKFVVLSPPKCGTHLLVKALSNLLDKQETTWLGDLPINAVELTEQITRDGGYAVSHNWDQKSLKDLIQKGYKVIFMLRDPRDHAISVLNWSYCPNWGGPLHILNIADRDERLTELICGSRGGWCCFNFIKLRLNLLKNLPKQSFYTAKFENLVGPKGGGSREKQIKELRSLSKFLNRAISEAKIEEVADSLWGSSPTFHIGKIGQWKKVMTPFHIEMYKFLYQNQLEKLMYETDENWG